ncbi:hypothetical protein BU17DRAFT_35613 [Hysterangium stoloniferum]|nr:hypothetical protein BU17DRAFT_35613 [Hysterangium stoloniferum]
MENPEEDVTRVVQLITMANTADDQRAALYKYFTAEPGFNHPMFSIAPSKTSRDDILRIYQ